MRRAQISMFLIIGLTLLLSVSVLILIVSESRQEETAPVEIAGLEENFLRSCLAASTQQALASLRDEGVITTDARGAHIPTKYIEDSEIYIMGRGNFVPLCSKTGANALQSVPLASCGIMNYGIETANQPSIQTSMQAAIRDHMQRCTEISSLPEVIIQRDSILVRWNDITRTEQTHLFSAWAGIRALLQQELTNTSHFLNETRSIALQGCDQCRTTEFSYIGNESDGTKRYSVVVAGEHVTTIRLANRGILIVNEDNDIVSPNGLISCVDGCTVTLISLDGDELFVSSTIGEKQYFSHLTENRYAFRVNENAGPNHCESYNPITIKDLHGIETRFSLSCSTSLP